MKKILLFLCLSIISTFSYSQLYIGANYSFNNNWVVNKQIISNIDEMNYISSFGNSYGGYIGYYFSNKAAIELGINKINFDQKYKGSIEYFDTYHNSKTNSYTSVLNLGLYDIPVLLKIGRSFYLEMGPVFQVLDEAHYSRKFNILSSDDPSIEGIYNNIAYNFSNENIKDVSKDFEKFGVGACAGIGLNLSITSFLKFNCGFRVNYIFNDYKGVNALGFNKENNYIPKLEKDLFKSRLVYGGVKLGLLLSF